MKVADSGGFEIGSDPSEIAERARAALSAVESSRGAPSARNLLITIFGDAIAPHDPDAAISVAALTELVSPFGVSERLVRTSLSRLVNDEILIVRPRGRRSYYAIAPGARSTFATAGQFIYDPTPPEWDGKWTIIIIDGLDATPDVRAELRGELIDRGMRSVVPNVLVSAVTMPDDIADVLTESEVGRVLVTRSETVELMRPGVDGRLANHAYPIGEWAQQYDEFVERFSVFLPGPDGDILGMFEPEEAFKLRTMLVASFRRILLPQQWLPKELLPQPWIGDTARTLAGELYRSCAEHSEGFLNAVVETRSGEFPPLRINLADRFR